MMSYGGVYLCQVTSEVADNIDYLIETGDIEDGPPKIETMSWSEAIRGRQPWAYPGTLPQPKIVPGRLYWPRSASRFAVAHMIATDTMLASIRTQVYKPSTLKPYTPTQYNPLPFVMDDGNGSGRSITTSLYLLPAKPLMQPNTGEVGLNLLTLVDIRYFWWRLLPALGGGITIVEGLTTWANLLSQIATLLNITLTADVIPTAYLYPPASMATSYDYVPPLLDAVCHAIGQRLVRRWDGTVVSQSATSAYTAQSRQLAQWAKEWGGTYSLAAGV